MSNSTDKVDWLFGFMALLAHNKIMFSFAYDVIEYYEDDEEGAEAIVNEDSFNFGITNPSFYVDESSLEELATEVWSWWHSGDVGVAKLRDKLKNTEITIAATTTDKQPSEAVRNWLSAVGAITGRVTLHNKIELPTNDK